jgi:hypothetical protein
MLTVFAAITIFLVCLMIFDSFVLPPILRHEVLKDGNTIVVEGYRNRGSRGYKLVTESGHRYFVPLRPYGAIGIGQQFQIAISRIFHRPLKVYWAETDNQSYATSIGLFNGFAIPVFVCIFIFCTVSPIIFLMRRKSPGRVAIVRVYAAMVFSIIVFLAYLFYPMA